MYFIILLLFPGSKEDTFYDLLIISYLVLSYFKRLKPMVIVQGGSHETYLRLILYSRSCGEQIRSPIRITLCNNAYFMNKD